MNRLCLTLLTCLSWCPCVFAGDSAATTIKQTPTIGTLEADKHYGKTLTVTGKVANITVRSKVVSLNLDVPYPDSPFRGVILRADRTKFENLGTLLRARMSQSLEKFRGTRTGRKSF